MSKLFYQGRGRKPVLDQARGVYMWDKNGRRYLDGSSGAMVCNIGHSNEHVLAAMQRQMEKSTFGYRLHFETEASENMAEKLAEKMPEGLDRVFFVSGGSEAVESAMKLARQYALAVGQGSRWKIISRTPSYHGCTLGALATTGYTTLTAPFEPMMRVMPKVPAPRAYLDGLDPDAEATGRHYADMLAERIEDEGPESVLAFLVEPIGGASTGALVSPPGYLERVREICDEYGILMILDEVMTGAGRTGAFLGVDHWGVRPDIVVLSKGIGSGYAPLGAMVADRRLVDPVLDAGGFAHGFTYAGNPLACAAGLAVLSEILERGLVPQVRERGAFLEQLLCERFGQNPHVGDIRGRGLFRGLEFVADRESKTPFEPKLGLAGKLKKAAFAEGLICYPMPGTRDGRVGDHILLAPPFIASEDELSGMVDRLERAVDRVIPGLGA